MRRNRVVDSAYVDVDFTVNAEEPYNSLGQGRAIYLSLAETQFYEEPQTRIFDIDCLKESSSISDAELQKYVRKAVDATEVNLDQVELKQL